MNNIYLIGMPGCGKSSLMSDVKKRLSVASLDLDSYIEEKNGKTISEIFEDGEIAFRLLETKALKEVSKLDNLLVATGGGIVTAEENIEIMKKSGKIIFIDASPDFIISNCSLSDRPLLKDKNRIYDLYKARISLYRTCADVTILNDGIFSKVSLKLEEVIRKIR